MAFIGCDGFEGLEFADITLRGWTVISAGAAASAGIDASGLNGRRLFLYTGGVNGFAESSARQVISPVTELIVGGAFRLETINTSGFTGLLAFGEATARHITVGLTDSGQFSVHRGNIDSPALGTSALALVAEGNWFYLEARVKLSDTVGEVEVFLEGESIISLSNIDTINGGTGVIDRFFLLASTASGLSLNARLSYDDIYWLDTAGAAPYNAPLGPVRVDRLLPNSDVAVQFTPSTGTSNFPMVNEALPNGDTNSVESATSGHKDAYGLTDLASPSGTVFAVVVRTRARRTDAAVTQIIPSIISGGVEGDGATRAVTASYEELTDVFTANPNGGGAWSDAAVNALTVAVRLP